MTQLSRRDVLALMTVGLAGAAMLSPLALAGVGRKAAKERGDSNRNADGSDQPAAEAQDKEQAFWRLVAPLQRGDYLSGFAVASAKWNSGSMLVQLQGSDGAAYQVSIFARDEGREGPSPIARTARHELYLINGGNGCTRTNENVGLAVMALGNVLSEGENRADSVATMTIREHWSTRAVSDSRSA